ncbi:Crp/Fnr family transcriptional regulator [Evansella sp. AB-rgal1]|uniref:Crp/Fnr family transcriptional regulator n=1 Tax=Evansella sp. AB-rgal1 TaxID=3242696 RepID=UPI00359EB183
MVRLKQSIDKMWYLSKVGFFDFLEEEELEKIIPLIQHQDIRRNMVIQTPDKVEKKLYFIKEGALKIYDINEDGKVFTKSLLGPFSTYGHLSTFSLGVENVFVETISDVHLCSISEEEFQSLIEKYPKLTWKAMQILTERLNEREKMLQVIATGTVKQQIKHLLVSLADTYGKENFSYVEIPFPLSHQEIANMLGVTRESVSTNMNRLKSEGYIRNTAKRTIEVNQLQISM